MGQGLAKLDESSNSSIAGQTQIGFKMTHPLDQFFTGVYRFFTARGIKISLIMDHQCTSEVSRFHFDLLRIKKDEEGRRKESATC